MGTMSVCAQKPLVSKSVQTSDGKVSNIVLFLVPIK